MAFLAALTRLPRTAVGLWIFKKELQIRPCGRRIVFHNHDRLSSCTLDQTTKLVIALCRIRRQNASFAQHLGQQRFESTDARYASLLWDTALKQCPFALHTHANRCCCGSSPPYICDPVPVRALPSIARCSPNGAAPALATFADRLSLACRTNQAASWAFTC